MRMAMVAAEIPSAVQLSAPVGSRSSLDWGRTKDIPDQFIAGLSGASLAVKGDLVGDDGHQELVEFMVALDRVDDAPAVREKIAF